MGSWGPGFFDNDEGSDLLYDLRRGDAADLVDGALGEWERHHDSGHWYALAGIACVASSCGYPDADDPVELQDMLAGAIAPEVLRGLLVRSVAVLESICADPAVVEIESGREAFPGKVAQLADALRKSEASLAASGGV